MPSVSDALEVNLKENISTLCKEAAQEEDLDRLLLLVCRINDLLKSEHSPQSRPTPSKKDSSA